MTYLNNEYHCTYAQNKYKCRRTSLKDWTKTLCPSHSLPFIFIRTIDEFIDFPAETANLQVNQVGGDYNVREV